MKWFYRNSGCGGADANSDEPQLIRISKVVKISESEDDLGGSEVTAGAAISAPSSAVAPRRQKTLRFQTLTLGKRSVNPLYTRTPSSPDTLRAAAAAAAAAASAGKRTRSASVSIAEVSGGSGGASSGLSAFKRKHVKRSSFAFNHGPSPVVGAFGNDSRQCNSLQPSGRNINFRGDS